MAQTLRIAFMADEAEQEIKTESIRVASDLVEMARFVTTRRKTPSGKRLKMVAYLDSILRGPITADYDAEEEKVSQERQAKTKQKKKA